MNRVEYIVYIGLFFVRQGILPNADNRFYFVGFQVVLVKCRVAIAQKHSSFGLGGLEDYGGGAVFIHDRFGHIIE